ncbi:PAS domain-containing protein [Microvirga sp. STS02]|uniref:PAS domain-containing protein n=1 Tax=Hymenobacter negativus TaxID=2795026 RepID=UPI0018DCB929|nr:MULTISPECIES: PAS domain-containing protein [Bacteria]MBH8568006.1 PAS domain-containing protein [Hymenobacter negativus]MBR7207742.1 PAS domain-containing protein [Microvirga sp. STS02]
MPAPADPILPADLPYSQELLQVVLNTSQTGFMLLRPVYAAAGTTIIDLAWEYLNPAAQQMLRLPQRPTESFLTLFPTAEAAGVFGFYRDAFLSGRVERRQNNYQHDGLDGYYLLVAQRQGEVLVVNFDDTNDQTRTDMVQELRASQVRELEARAEAELQRQHLELLLHDAPAMICVFDGPQHVFQFVNPPYQALVGDRPIVGKPIAEAMPELVGQPIFGLLDNVYRTGETFRASEMLVQLDHDNEGRRELEKRYYNFIYQARHNQKGTINGIFVFAYDVTPQVLARQEIQALNEELAAINEELRASNDEFLTTNTALVHSEQQLSALNQELESRVAARTHDAQNARAEAEHQQARLKRLFMAAPAAICILAGPRLVYELVNPNYQALFPGRALLGRPIAEALPEIADHAVYQTFRRVFETGITHEEPGLLIPIARPADGVLEDRYFNYIQQARFDEQGGIDGVLVFAFEVTPQVLARQATEAGAQRLQLLTDALPVLISYIDRNEQYQFLNQAYQSWFGRAPAGMVGLPVRQVLGEVAYAAVRGYVARALAGERLEFEAHMPYREDFVRHIHTDYIPDVQQGEVQGFYALVTDITEQVEARQQVQELNEELAAINEEMLVANEDLRDTNDRLSRTNVDLDTFVYTASHDLKAPIANIEGLLLALGEQLPAAVRHTPDVTQLLALMHGAVFRFQSTLGHLTDVSKLQHAHAEPAEAVDLAALAGAVRLDLLPALTAAGGHLVLDVAACATVRFSPKNLRSILYNLLSNAIKYQVPGRTPHVLLRATRTPGQVRLEVHDNGLGLTENEQTKLFVMFRRLHTHVEGTGVGLYMVKRIVENAGGTIQVQSAAGVGSTFTVVLPDRP